MSFNIQKCFKNLLKQSQISKGELLTFTRIAGKHVSPVKPLRAFVNNVEFHAHSVARLNHHVQLTPHFKRDISSLLHHMESYDHNKQRLESVFDRKRPIQINAYSMSALKDYVKDFDLSYFKESQSYIASESEFNTDNEYNELLSIYVLLNMYCETFQGKHVAIHSDRVSAITMLNKYCALPSKPHLQSPINKIAALCLTYHINPTWSRLAGVPVMFYDKNDKALPNVSDPFNVRIDASC